ncbi:jg15314 [Pararge aegeria aegeria]|uniref:Jg15314 protein n=1 Tax=Pararge aegeria aegeria TaxID=348720 RepID=A0A8S4R6Y6_9NEOP|nr:jg15314 [Pararge aegeria aegeria]
MSHHGCPERLSNRSKGFQEDGSGQPTMEVLVETLTGTAFEMTVSPSDTIFAIKSKIFRVEGIPVSQQHLLYNLRELDDALSLREHAIGDGARLRLVLGLRGGPVATRRLPPPEPWRDIERLLHSNRDEGEWGGSGSGSGCKATVLVFREGERVNLVRVRENKDGTYSPLDHAKYSSSLGHLAEAEADEASGALHDNAVTMGKMLELRRRMETLSVQRRAQPPGEKHEIQKTRSEETLSVPSLLDDGPDFATRTYNPYSEAEDMFAPLYDGNYTRYDYDCSFADRYTLLPPIGTRTDSDQSIQDAVADERLKLSDALAGSILVKAREGEEAAILEECLDREPCLHRDAAPLAAKSLAPIPAAEYGESDFCYYCIVESGHSFFKVMIA